MSLAFRRFFHFLPVAVLLLLLSGCYFDRLTGRYDEFPELGELGSAVLEQSSPDGETEEERLKRLTALENAPLAPYTINAGDNISIVVYNNPDLTTRVAVTPDGYIGMVFAGQVKVAGLTIEQAIRLIEQKLSKYIRNPKVGVSPSEIRSETVTIAGAVVKPGMYDITNGMRLADLFAKAGGGATRLYDGQMLDATNFDRSVFLRDNQVVPLDFRQAIASGLKPHNILLRKGDYIYIAPREDSMVYVVGDVKKSFRQLWSKRLGLLELLAESGWVNETHWSHVIIIRGGIARPRMYKVDLDGIISGKKANVLLEAGDIVYVPHDNISEYNVFVRKLLPTGQLLNMITTPMTWRSTLGF